MIDADAINAASEDGEQAILRKQAMAAVREGGPKHYFSASDTFDRIPGVGLCRRNNHTAPLLVVPDGTYGS